VAVELENLTPLVTKFFTGHGPEQIPFPHHVMLPHKKHKYVKVM
jgi:hypothetical protein